VHALSGGDHSFKVRKADLRAAALASQAELHARLQEAIASWLLDRLARPRHATEAP
jgi:hypothetical protein